MNRERGNKASQENGALPPGWAWTTLGKVRVDDGRSLDPRSHPNEMFELYSVPGYADRKPEFVLGRDVGSNKQTVESETVLLCKINPHINRVWVVSELSTYRKIASTEWIPFFPVEGIAAEYLAYFMQNEDFRSFLAINVSGVGGSLMRVRPNSVEDYPFPLPPLPEQHRIVAAIETQFTRLDAGVAALKRIQAGLRRYKASVLKAACEGRLAPTEAELARVEGRSYEPADALLARILAERRRDWEAAHPGKRYEAPPGPDTRDLPELAKGWVWAALPQIGVLARGKSKHRPRNAPHLYEGPYPFIQTGEIKQADGTITTYSQTYSEAGLAQSHLWPKGTLCITIAANIAETAILGFDACFPDSVVGFIGTREACNVHFVEYFIRTAKDDLDRYAPATAQKNINLDTLEKLAIALPPLAEQHRIVTEVELRLSVVAEVEAAMAANLRRAARLRQAILRQAFAGKLAPQDPNDEPASALLKRIRAA